MLGSSGGMVTVQTPSAPFASGTGGRAPIQFPESSTAGAVGAQSLKVTIVPDSGTDQLTGITGTMAIDIRDGKHFYTFDYTLPAR